VDFVAEMRLATTHHFSIAGKDNTIVCSQSNDECQLFLSD
jgi:hypothetical protein